MFNVDFRYNLVSKNNNRQNRQRNIILFNIAKQCHKNFAKRFLDLLDKHFSPNNQLHKIFNRNIVRVRYYCPPNVSFITNSIKQRRPMLKTRK